MRRPPWLHRAKSAGLARALCPSTYPCAVRSLQEHLESPSLGVPPSGAATEGCAGGSCGVIARFFLVVAEDTGVIRECSARVRGRASAFATASALCEQATGLTVAQAAALGLDTLHESFAAMSEEDRERALVVEDAFHQALGTWLVSRAKTGTPVTWNCKGLDVVVAMSGGVDSAVALHSVMESSRSVAGMTLQLWIDPQAPDPDSACCAPDSVRRARKTCHAIGVPHFSIDLRHAFLQQVVAPFVGAYAAGSTPNPCVRCNGSFRLHELQSLAQSAGATRVATGHYVRQVHRNGQTLLRAGVDERKDQSYMLAQLDPATIAHYEFPLGELRKPQVREMARRLQLEQATVRESQEVCFLGGGDYRGFLARSDALGKPGTIVDPQGRVLARHDGIARFTPGQRRGLGEVHATAGGPWYVLDTDPDTGTVTVGSREQLARPSLTIHSVKMWDSTIERVAVKTRYRTRDGAVYAKLVHLPDQRALLEFERPVSAIAPGQLACMYDDDGVVVGSGIIERAPNTGSAPEKILATGAVGR